MRVDPPEAGPQDGAATAEPRREQPTETPSRAAEPTTDARAFLAGGGACGAILRGLDWAGHPLGPPEAWPAALKLALRVMLTTEHPVFVFWGPELFCFYNDAYSRSVGPERHPGMMGMPGRIVWDEIWDVIGPQIAQVMSGRGATWNENHLVPITRAGRREDVWWTYSYSPIDEPSAPAGVGGVLVLCAETTAQMRALMEARELEAVYEAAPMGLCVLDRELRYLRINERLAAINGRTAADHVGRRVTEVLPPPLAATLAPFYARVLAGETVETVEIVGLHPALGRPGVWLVSGRPFGATDDPGRALLVTVIDVTERRAADRALAESEARLRLGLSIAEIGLGAIDYRAGMITLDATAAAIFDLPAHEPLSRAVVHARFHPEDWRALAADIAALVEGAGGGMLAVEHRVLSPDGRERRIFARKQVFHETGPDGVRRATHGLLALRDVTEERRAEEARAARQRLDGYLLALEEGLRAAPSARAAADGACARLARALGADLVGFGEIEADGRRSRVASEWRAEGVASVLGAHDLADYGLARLDMMRRGEMILVEDVTTDVRTAGTGAVAAFAAVGVRASLDAPLMREGRLRAVLFAAFRAPHRWSFEEVALARETIERAWQAIERARAEEALRLLNAELESRVAAAVAEREAALAQLHEAQKMEALGRMTGGVAHDFNNLIAAVLSNLDAARRRVDDPGASRLMEGAIQAAERGAGLTKRLLAFARRQELAPEPVALGPLVEGMLDMLARVLGPSVAIRVEAPADLPPALVDRNQLELAILNLAVNARDAMPEGGTLRIAAAAEEAGGRAAGPALAPGRYLRLTVADDGLGMDETVRRRAAEPFFTTKPIGQGTGLGLSMVHGLAAQSGGALAIESAPERGATVAIWLPQAERAATEPAAAPSPEPAARAGLTVLLVEDDPLVAMGAAAMLEDLGHVALEAASGRDALATIASRADVDLVITDQGMPGMTGVELASALAVLRPGLPVILATGYADAVLAGDPGLPRLGKPYAQAALAAAIAAALEPDRPPDRPDAAPRAGGAA